MAKQLTGTVKFQVPGGQATPAPPVGTSLGRFGINLGQFVQQFNERTKETGGMPIPVVVNVYNDRSFDFVTKSPPAAALLKKAASVAKGSGTPNKEKVGKVTRRRDGAQHGHHDRRLAAETSCRPSLAGLCEAGAEGVVAARIDEFSDRGHRPRLQKKKNRRQESEVT